jgi:hypothetical protein
MVCKERVPVGFAYHYTHRDDCLKIFTSAELFCVFRVRKMNAADKKWFEFSVTAREVERQSSLEMQSPPSHPISDLAHPGTKDDFDDRQNGRKTHRYFFQPEHPLHMSHILVKRAKPGVIALAGNPPPSFEKSPHAFAAYYIANHVPWSLRTPPRLTLEFSRIRLVSTRTARLTTAATPPRSGNACVCLHLEDCSRLRT